MPKNKPPEPAKPPFMVTKHYARFSIGDVCEIVIYCNTEDEMQRRADQICKLRDEGRIK